MGRAQDLVWRVGKDKAHPGSVAHGDVTEQSGKLRTCSRPDSDWVAAGSGAIFISPGRSVYEARQNHPPKGPDGPRSSCLANFSKWVLFPLEEA